MTGDELVPPEALPGPGQIRDSHSDFLLAAGRSLGLRFAALGIAPDDPASLAAAIQLGGAGGGRWAGRKRGLQALRVRLRDWSDP